jgi:uncharacterized membrane-anchored protein
MNQIQLNKVASITLLFWMMKIVATTLGETLGDHLSMTLNLGYTGGLGITFALFIFALILQLRSTQYTPINFWLVIIATTTLGTEVSDFMDRTLHFGYTIGSAVLFVGLLIVLFLWHRKHKSLEVYPILDRKIELFYWCAILFSNSLGTAFGDYLSDVVGLSYLNRALVTAVVFVLVVLLHYYTKINHVLLFWIAFIFTRPFGTTFGDFLTKPIAKGGLEFGTLSAFVIAVAIMSYMIWLATKQLKLSQKNRLNHL